MFYGPPCALASLARVGPPKAANRGFASRILGEASAYQLPSMAFYDFYTNNVRKEDFIETIEPILTRFCIGRLLWTTLCARFARASEASAYQLSFYGHL